MKTSDMVKAIEVDARQSIPGLADAINEAKAGAGQVHTPEQILLRSVRKSMKMNQSAFAEWLETPVGTLRDWEQGRFPVPGPVKKLLLIVAKNPELAEGLA